MKTKKAKVWIFQTGEPLPIDGCGARPMRAMNLSAALQRKGIETTIWSSRFCHQTKKIRRIRVQKKVAPNLKVKLISSPGYNKNISIKRFIDHIILAKNLKKILTKEKNKPDIAFIGYPPIEFAFEAVSFCKKHNIPCFLDVKDQWPDTILEGLPLFLRGIGKIALKKLNQKATQTMQNATCICTITKEYYNWILKKSGRKKSKNDLIVPLVPAEIKNNTLQNKQAKKWWEKNKVYKKTNNFRICFVGNLGLFTDIEEIIEWVKKFNNDEKVKIEFVVCGNGDKLKKVEQASLSYPLIKCVGRIDYFKVCFLYGISSAMIAPIKNSSNFGKSVSNKIHEALSFSLPVVTQLSGSTKRILKESNSGYFYKPHNYKSFKLALKKCIKESRLKQSKKIRYKIKNKDYIKLASRIDKIIKNKNNLKRFIKLKS